MSKKNKKPNSSIGILGYGAVGKAILGLYGDSCFGYPSVKDIYQDGQDNFDYNVDMDVLNVCIPYTDDFVKYVVDEINATHAELTIIHSTVAPLTTKTIRDTVNKPVVHSPVVGPEEDLYTSLWKHFNRFIGAENEAEIKMVKEHYSFLGYKHRPKCYTPAVVTELNKLISTSYYGVCIAYTDYVDKLHEIYKIPYKGFEEFNNVYNRGYRRLRMKRFNRPTLYPPRGEIGGHCVMPNAKILQKSLDHKLIQSILEVK